MAVKPPATTKTVSETDGGRTALLREIGMKQGLPSPCLTSSFIPGLHDLNSTFVSDLCSLILLGTFRRRG
jgi:hypothetical protein